MKIPHSILLLAVTVLAAAGAPLVAAPKEKPSAGAVFDFAKAPADQVGTFVAVTRGPNLKKVKKLAIVNFTLEFVTAKGASVATRSGYKSSSVAVPALDTDAARTIADGLHDQLVADLQACGVEVIPFATIKASKEFAKLKGAQHDTPWQLKNPNGLSTFVGAHGMPIYVDNVERFEGWNAAGVTFGTNTRLHEVMLCNEFGANLLSVNIVIDFADIKTGRFFTNVETSYAHYLPAKHTRYRFAAVGQPDFVWLALGTRLESGNTPLVELGSTGTQKGTSIDGTVTESAEAISVSFDQALYLRDSERMARAANAMFVAAFCKERGTSAPASTTQPLP